MYVVEFTNYFEGLDLKKERIDGVPVVQPRTVNSLLPSRTLTTTRP